MEIKKLTAEALSDAAGPNQPFEIFGRVIPALAEGEWTYSEELFENPYLHSYPEDVDYSQYIDSPDRAVFLAYSGSECIGRIVLRKEWNGYAFVEDICVSAASRGQGVGRSLMDEAVRWAKENGLGGLALETQDSNLRACRFYSRYGFVIGAVNTMLYKNLPPPFSHQTAIFWYLRF